MTAYLNVYELDRHYGGPEEGGWWYDSKTPVALVVVPDAWVDYIVWDEDDEPFTWHARPEFEQEVNALRDKLETAFPLTNRRGLTTYRGGDYGLSFECEPPQEQPTERPYYS